MIYKHNKCHSCYELCLNHAEAMHLKDIFPAAVIWKGERTLVTRLRHRYALDLNE